MTFGLCNAPATFQRIMNNMFEHMVDEGHVVVYLDNILIFSEVPALLEKLTHEVLSCLEEYNLYLKPEKCVFAQTSIEYLGIVIKDGHVMMDPAKVDGVAQWPMQHTVKQVQACLGLSRPCWVLGYVTCIKGFTMGSRGVQWESLGDSRVFVMSKDSSQWIEMRRQD